MALATESTSCAAVGIQGVLAFASRGGTEYAMPRKNGKACPITKSEKRLQILDVMTAETVR